MKVLILLPVFCIVTLCACSSLKYVSSNSSRPMHDNNTSKWITWKVYMDNYKKEYESPEEEFVRQQIFYKNLKIIERHNLFNSKSTYTMGINKYSDLDHTEFVKMMNGYRMNASRSERRHYQTSTYLSPNIPLQLPNEVDWRQHGYVTPVKDQGECGSCWAFSSTGSLEGQTFRKTGSLVSLSEQNLIDCSFVWGNDGCLGGKMDFAFDYIKDNYGIDMETSYPYTAKAGTCHYTPASKGASDSGYVDVPKGDESALQEAVAIFGPISVAIDASQPSFQFYKNGVYDEYACTQNLDHAVLVVGYGRLNGLDYWLVKNSWGTSWGDKGYIMMSRNKGNQCGIVSMASYPLV